MIRWERCGSRDHYPPRADICHYRQISLNENLTLPCEKPDIEQLLDITAHPYIDDCVLTETPVGKKLIIRGHVEQTVIYVADLPCQSVHAAHFKVPFCLFEEMPSHCSMSTCDLYHPQVLVEYLSASRLGPKAITKCVFLFIWWPFRKHHSYPCKPAPQHPLSIPEPYPSSPEKKEPKCTGGDYPWCRGCDLYVKHHT